MTSNHEQTIEQRHREAGQDNNLILKKEIECNQSIVVSMDTNQTTIVNKLLLKSTKDSPSQSKMSNRIDQVLNRIELKLSELKQMLSSSSAPIVSSVPSSFSPSPLSVETAKQKSTTIAETTIKTVESNQSELDTCCASITQQSQQPLVSSLKSKTIEKESKLIEAADFDCTFNEDRLPTDMLKSSHSNIKPIKRVMFADGSRPGDSFDDKPQQNTITHVRKRRSSSALTKKSSLTSAPFPVLPANHALVPFFGFNLISSKASSMPLNRPKSSSSSNSNRSKSKSNNSNEKRRSKAIVNMYSNDWSDRIDWNQYNPSSNSNWLSYTIDEEVHLLYTSRINQTFLLGWLIKNESAF